MEPPPAPIDCASIECTRISAPATEISERMIGLPDTITPTSKLVPPMSMVTMLSKPACAPVAREPITPPAGPENSA
jgi:hypothetical protein